jgi:diguanylate cyclase (GGDEF)-like protein
MEVRLNVRQLLAGAALLSAAFLSVLLLPVPAAVELWVSDLGQLLAAAAAAAGCAVAALRSDGHRRRAWWWLTAATAAWAVGQAAWSWYELVLDQPAPFPSLADLGFLGFTVASTVGLVVWLGSQSHLIAARGRDLLDGAIIAVALLLLSWVTTLGTVVFAPGFSTADLLLSLAYPLGDLVLATLVLLALARGTSSERTTLAILTLGLGGLALSDSVYVYLTSTKQYSSADLVTSGWVIGFLLVAVAGLGVCARTPAGAHAPHQAPERVAAKPALLQLCLPYVPVLAASVMLAVSLRDASITNRGVDLLLGVVLVVLVLARQFVAVLDTTRLMSELRVVRDQLEHQALHDALTGLANRVLFADRLDRALLHPGANVSVLYCDLDDFKNVNDGLGHATGDELLKLVAQRLLECTRVTDTVARLGGDEFAILLEDADDAVQVAERVVTALKAPVELFGQPVSTSVSIGIAHHRDTVAMLHPEHRRETDSGPLRGTAAQASAADARREATAALLLRQADTAMYAAKGGGKGRAVLSQPARPAVALEEPA